MCGLYLIIFTLSRKKGSGKRARDVDILSIFSAYLLLKLYVCRRNLLTLMLIRMPDAVISTSKDEPP